MFFLRSKKKGMATQVEWAICLAIFILFVFWYFILLRQVYLPEPVFENNVLEIMQKFKSSVAFSYNQIPIYVISSYDVSYAPILARNPTNWTNYALDENHFSALDGDFIYFMRNISSGTNLFMLQSSEREYDSEPMSEFITKSANTVSVPSLSYSVTYPNNILRTIFYEGSQQLYDFNTYINGEEIEITNATEHLPGYFVRHNLNSEFYNLRSYIFPENSHMANIMQISSTVASNVTFTLEFVMPHFDFYFIDKIIPYNVDFSQGCIETENDFIDFKSNNNHSIMFIFDEVANFEICDVSTIQELNRMSFKVDLDYSPSSRKKSKQFFIYSHNSDIDGDPDKIITPHNVHIGARERFIGISRSKLLELRTLSNDELFELWSIPTNRDFSIIVTDINGNSIYDFRTSSSTGSDVYSRTFREFLINEFGQKEFVYISINIW